MMQRARLLVAFCLIWGLSACAARHPEISPAPTEPETVRKLTTDSYRFSAEVDKALGTRVWTAEDLYEEGENRYFAAELGLAEALYHRLLDEFPDSRFLAPTLLRLGQVNLEQGESGEALTWFQRYLKEFPTGEQRWIAWGGLGNAYAAQSDWTASERAFRELLALDGLATPVDDSARVRLARALTEQNRLDEASVLLQDVIKRHGPTAPIHDAYPDDAETGPMARYYLGEVARRRADAIKLTTFTDLSAADADLERKAKLTLEAHDHYYRTCVYGVPAWTGAAAYRMGYNFEGFYRALMDTPAPEELTPEEVVIYKELLDEQLDKVVWRAYDLYSQVIRYKEEFHLDEHWVEECRKGMARLEERAKKSTPPKGASDKGQTPASGSAPAEASPPSSADGSRARL